MPSQSVDVTLFANGMKDDYYKQYIISQLNDNQKAVSLFTKDTEGFESGGNQLVASIKTARNYGVRAISDGGMLAAPKSPKWNKLFIPKRYVYGTVQITGGAIKQSLKSKATFEKALDAVSEDLVESIDRFRNRALSMAGNGILALVNGAGTGTTTINVDNAGNFVNATNGARYLNPGMDVAIVNASTGAVFCFRTIADGGISANGQQITFTQAVSPGDAPDNAAIVLASTDGTDVETSFGIEPMGIFGLVDDGTYNATYFGVPRSSNAILNSTVIPTAGVLTSLKLQRGMDGCDRKSDKVPDVHLMDHSVRREYLGSREADFRYESDKMAPDLGFEKGAMNGEVKYTKSDIMPMKDFPYGFWVGLRKDTMVRTIDAEGEWISEDGAILSRLPLRDVFVATYRIFENYWCKQPNASFREDGITATVDVDHIF